MMSTLKVASRKSPLAMAQTHWVISQLQQHHPDLTVELVTFQTQGDQFLEQALSAVGGKGLFVKELEEALLSGQADFAVHSMKDMPAHLPAGLQMQSFGPRECPEDAFLSNRYDTLQALPQGAVVGTASLRRKALLLRHRPDLKIELLRGNVQTRLKKLDDGQYDAIVLATAGLNRLQLSHRITQHLTAETFTPACGQGTLCVEFRQGDERVAALLNTGLHAATQVAFRAEFAFLQTLQGGCQTPMAAYAEPLDDDTFMMRAFIADPSAKPFLYTSQAFKTLDAEQTGVAIAQQLLEVGGRQILETLSVLAH